MLTTLSKEESHRESGLLPMNGMFTRLSIIIFLAIIFTLPGILKQIMLVLGGFWKLRCRNSLSKK